MRRAGRGVGPKLGAPTDVIPGLGPLPVAQENA